MSVTYSLPFKGRAGVGMVFTAREQQTYHHLTLPWKGRARDALRARSAGFAWTTVR
jgi:hypothetical protein